MYKNVILILITLIFSACSGSDVLKDIFGFKETKGHLYTANMNSEFTVVLDVNNVAFNSNNPLPTDIVRASYFIEDEDGKQLFEYKAVSQTEITTRCVQNLVTAAYTEFVCDTSYSNSQAYPGYDRTKTINIYENKTYYVKMEETRALSSTKYKNIGTIQLK